MAPPTLDESLMPEELPMAPPMDEVSDIVEPPPMEPVVGMESDIIPDPLPFAEEVLDSLPPQAASRSAATIGTALISFIFGSSESRGLRHVGPDRATGMPVPGSLAARR